ncbi:MAG: SAM-dependent chlorinase/fluorinase [Candidatus Brocadiaceae bacterium]|nr:SAM-dependent chlorinase/fluorinase [Candidatus Brocadiaceae bacterium]
MVKHRQPVIALLTDFGAQDAYVGIMKGVIAAINPQSSIIDICHSIPPQDIFQGAYLLYTAYKYFPKDTIHVAVVDPGVGSERDIVCVHTKDYLFLAPDNGILGFILPHERPQTIVRITNKKYFLPSPSTTFHGRDIFAPVAAHLSLGVKLQQLGIETDHLNTLCLPMPRKKRKGGIEGEVIAIDRFGNLITNITKDYLKGLKCPQRNIGILIGKRKITGLGKSYAEANIGMPLALFGSSGFLEVSINQGNAGKYFKVEKGAKVAIDGTLL